jgi:hypothetical protein
VAGEVEVDQAHLQAHTPQEKAQAQEQNQTSQVRLVRTCQGLVVPPQLVADHQYIKTSRSMYSAVLMKIQ